MELNTNSFDNLFEQTENSQGYASNILIEQAKIKLVEKEGKITLKKDNNIKQSWIPKAIREKLNRKNIVYLGMFTSEVLVKMEEAQGKLALSVINRESVNKLIQKIKTEHQSKIAYVHIGTIQILLKSTFFRKIKSPVQIVIVDERIKKTKEKIIGGIEGNLAYTAVKFNVNLQYAIPISSINLSNSIGIMYKFLEKDLMDKKDIPFSVTYAVNYALTNSHHSLDFLQKEQIEVETLFAETSTQKRLLKGIGEFYPHVKIKGTTLIPFVRNKEPPLHIFI